MISKHLKKYMEDSLQNGKTECILSAEEKAYIEKHDGLGGISIAEEKEPFVEAYIELSDKETEEMIAEKDTSFLGQPVSYFKEHINQFLYVEAVEFERIGVDSACFEVDDIFGSYEALLGLKLQKKHDKAIKEYVRAHIDPDKGRFSMMFNANEGIWDINVSLDGLPGFDESFTVKAALSFIRTFLFGLMEAVEAA